MSGETGSPVVIPWPLLSAIYAQAREEFPRECCGYLRGRGPAMELVRCANIMDALHAEDPEMFPRTAQNGYVFDFAQTRDFDRSFSSALPATIVYHSHPRVGAYFSEEDTRAALASGYDVDYLVVDAQEDGVREARLFRRDGEAFSEVARFPGAPIKLYGHPRSGHAHRVELFLSLLGLPIEKIDIDRSRRQDPEFLALNPMGQVPVIDDGGVVLADSNAILVYLARRYDRAGRWYPVDEPAQAARVQRWLSIAAGELRYGPAFARAAKVFGVAIDEALTQSTSARVLALLERSLAGAAFLVGDGPTIADVALYTYTAHAPEGGLSLAPYPNLRAWLERVEALPGFVAMLRSAA